MTISTVTARLLASPFATTLLLLVFEVLPTLLKIAKRIIGFQTGNITPATTDAFEKELDGLLREVGRVTLGWVYNRLEPDKEEDAPELAGLDGECYRRRSALASALWRGHVVRYHCVVADWL